MHNNIILMHASAVTHRLAKLYIRSNIHFLHVVTNISVYTFTILQSLNSMQVKVMITKSSEKLIQNNSVVLLSWEKILEVKRFYTILEFKPQCFGVIKR